MRRLFLIAAVLAWAVPASAQNCITLNGVSRCANPQQIYDGTVRTGISLPVLDLTQVWNDPSVTFTALKLNVTDTNSATASLLLDLQVGGTSKFSVSKAGAITAASTFTPTGAVQAPDGACGTTPGWTWGSQATFGFYRAGTSQITLCDNTTKVLSLTTSAGPILPTNRSYNWSASSSDPLAGVDTQVLRNAAGIVGTTQIITDGTDSTLVTHGDLTRQRNSYTITPATGGAGNCATAFNAAALTADCVVGTLPAGMRLTSIVADVTAGFTCSGTCTGTKVVQCGTAAGGTQILAAGLNVAATGQLGLADADLGSGMTRAAAIQGGLLNSWSATTPVSCRFTSGTGNWGSGAATFVNAGSIKFILTTEQVK